MMPPCFAWPAGIAASEASYSGPSVGLLAGDERQQDAIGGGGRRRVREYQSRARTSTRYGS